MSTGPDRWEKLNAFVDGELDAQGKAEIAAEIARDRDFAAAAATLARLKAATGEAFADAPAVAIDTAPPGMMRRTATVIATTAAAGAAAAAIWLTAVPAVPPSLDLAVSRHAGWVAGETAPSEPLAAPLLVGLARLDRPVELPDLRDSGLQIVRIAALDDAGDPAGLHIAYLGSRGCRVSLVVAKAGPEIAPLRTRIGGMDIARWTADELAYTLLASGMPRERFALIASSAEQAVRQHRPPPEPIREALRRERDGSAPCTG